MIIHLLSCTAQRPDRIGIEKCIADIASNISISLSKELTAILLEGDMVDIEVLDKNSGSALRALRKLAIDYKIMD